MFLVTGDSSSSSRTGRGHDPAVILVDTASTKSTHHPGRRMLTSPEDSELRVRPYKLCHRALWTRCTPKLSRHACMRCVRPTQQLACALGANAARALVALARNVTPCKLDSHDNHWMAWLHLGAFRGDATGFTENSQMTNSVLPSKGPSEQPHLPPSGSNCQFKPHRCCCQVWSAAGSALSCVGVASVPGLQHPFFPHDLSSSAEDCTELRAFRQCCKVLPLLPCLCTHPRLATASGHAG